MKSLGEVTPKADQNAICLKPGQNGRRTYVTKENKDGCLVLLNILRCNTHIHIYPHIQTPTWDSLVVN